MQSEVQAMADKLYELISVLAQRGGVIVRRVAKSDCCLLNDVRREVDRDFVEG